jgi:hypothetical protein
MHRVLLATAVLGALGCTPELGDTPFSCAAGGICPEGYTCRSTVCVRDGAQPGPARPSRFNWINAGEMHWVARAGGGAALVVNDGFTPAAHGIYEIRVSPDGLVEAPRLLVGYGDELPIASSVVALDDARYAIATLRFPRIDEDEMTLEILAVARDAPEGAAPGHETLYREQEPFLGGVEPPYLGAVAASGAIDVAWTRPSQAGRVEVLRVERSGSVWSKTGASVQNLPGEILPLSGDCALWRSGDQELTVRVGFESFAVGRVDSSGTLSPLAMVDGVPLYGSGQDLLLLRYGEEDESTGSYAITYAQVGLDGQVRWEEPGGVLQAALEPYSATAFEGGALIAPLSDDPAFGTLSVGWWSPSSTGIARVASVARTSTNDLYSARALGAGGKVYLAWTEFHESLMDLWVATADLSSGVPLALHGSGHRVLTWGLGRRAPSGDAKPHRSTWDAGSPRALRGRR